MKDAEQQVKRQLGKERREAGFSKPIPGEIWMTLGVKQAMQVAVDHLESVGKADFEEDYPLLEKINKLNNSVNAEYERRVLNISSSRATITESRNAQSMRRHPEKHTQVTQGIGQEWQCAEAVGDFFAREMAQDHKVWGFQHQFSGGKLLSLEQAWDVLTSPMFQTLSLYDFSQLDLPHAYWPGRLTLLPSDSQEDLLPLRAEDIDTPNEPEAVRDGENELRAVVEIETSEGVVIRRWVPVTSSTVLGGTYPFVTREEFFGEEGPTVDPALEAYEHELGAFMQEYNDMWTEDALGSVALEATETAFHLMTCDWPISLADALRFVLTGLPPRIAPIEINHTYRTPHVHKYPEINSGECHDEMILVDLDHTYMRAVLFVQPWVQPEAVASFWRQMRIGSNRTLPLADNLLLFRFVIKQSPWGRPFQWQALADQWNQESGQNLSRSVVQTIFARTRAALLPWAGERDDEDLD